MFELHVGKDLGCIKTINSQFMPLTAQSIKVSGLAVHLLPSFYSPVNLTKSEDFKRFVVLSDSKSALILLQKKRYHKYERVSSDAYGSQLSVLFLHIVNSKILDIEIAIFAYTSADFSFQAIITIIKLFGLCNCIITTFHQFANQ